MPILDVDLEQARKVYDTNVMGIIYMVQAFSKLLVQRKGTIINIGSIAGYAPVPWQAVYDSSKAAVNMLTDVLRIEMEPLGVKVILVRTPFIPPSPFLSVSDTKKK